MDDQMSPGLRILFLVHAIVAAVVGLPLFIAPGSFLTFVGWRPEMVDLPPEWGIPAELGLQIPGTTFVDPVVTRILGAAMIALAISSFLGWRSSNWGEVKNIVVLEVVFCVLSVIAIVFTMVRSNFEMPVFGYVTATIFALFAVAWVWFLWRR
jgi:hypothetical protein